MLVDAIAGNQAGGSPTRARTWDLRINSPRGAFVISLHHQLLTASAQPRHRSRMQCNARICKTTLLRFCIQVTITNTCDLRVLREISITAREFSDPYGLRVAQLSGSHVVPGDSLV